MNQTRQSILNSIPATVEVCAVTKGRSLKQVEDLLKECPQISIIGENRWPDCEEKFRNLAPKRGLKRHFIGRLQSNKLNKILPIVDVIQSVDSLELLRKINDRTPHPIEYCLQVNISNDPSKQGIKPSELRQIIKEAKDFGNVQLIGLMTIGSQENQEQYFSEFKTLFDEISAEFGPLQVLSMGTSGDYQLAIKHGATMVRLGTCLFE